MNYSMTIKVPGLPSTPNSRMNWRVKARDQKMWREKSAWIAAEKKPFRPMVDVSLQVVRHSAVMMDFDNLVASCKPLIDGLRDAGVIWNDDSKTIVDRQYHWTKGEVGAGMIEISVSGTLVTEAFLAAEEEKRIQREIQKAKRIARKALKTSRPLDKGSSGNRRPGLSRSAKAKGGANG